MNIYYSEYSELENYLANESIMKYLFLLLTFFAVKTSGQDLKIGDKAPEITMKDIHGNEVKLSSLKGKVVLIDFWASWCKPCRKENPEIVKAYQDFRDKAFKNGDGFTVFSVSLDSKRTAWEKAITSDNLTWEYHVSDLKGWENKAARLYHIASIPQSYLIDGDGDIIAVNPRGGALERELKKFRKKNNPFFDFIWFFQN